MTYINSVSFGALISKMEVSVLNSRVAVRFKWGIVCHVFHTWLRRPNEQESCRFHRKRDESCTRTLIFRVCTLILLVVIIASTQLLSPRDCSSWHWHSSCQGLTEMKLSAQEWDQTDIFSFFLLFFFFLIRGMGLMNWVSVSLLVSFGPEVNVGKYSGLGYCFYFICLRLWMNLIVIVFLRKQMERVQTNGTGGS